MYSFSPISSRVVTDQRRRLKVHRYRVSAYDPFADVFAVHDFAKDCSLSVVSEINSDAHEAPYTVAPS